MLNEAQKTAIRHLTPPQADRQMTVEALAELIGVTPRAIQKWQKGNPEFIAALEKSREAYKNDPAYFDRIARHHAMEALLQGAMQDAKNRDEVNDKRACIKELLAQTKHVADSHDRVDMATFTDAELLDMALKGNVEVDGVDISAIRGEQE